MPQNSKPERSVKEIIESMEKPSAVIPASVVETNDIEVTAHGMGWDLAQNGFVIHVEDDQLDQLITVLNGGHL